MLMKPVTENQLLALAGMFQCCQLVDELARNGRVDSQQLEIFLSALLNQNPASVYAVYGDSPETAMENLRPGLECMQQVLVTDAKGNPNILRYLVSVAFLATKLEKNPALLNNIGDSLARANQQAETFSISHENVIGNLAQLYKDTIGSFKQRIQVNGFAEHLQQQAIADRIRCLLFAAIRSAILWRQVGGRRYQLFFQRKKLNKLIMQHLQR